MAYGVVVGLVAGAGLLHPGAPDGRLLILAALASAPVLLALVPCFYVLGSMAWNVAGGEVPAADATAWPVTIVYGALFALGGFLNALLWSGALVALGRSVRRRVTARRGG